MSVMHISIVNISRTVKDKVLLLPINMKSHVGYRLAYLDLTLIHCKGQGQDHGHFDCEYI